MRPGVAARIRILRVRKVGVNMELMNFLKDWIKTHIVGTDKKLGAWLASKGVK
jgi:hemerythrin